ASPRLRQAAGVAPDGSSCRALPRPLRLGARGIDPFVRARAISTSRRDHFSARARAPRQAPKGPPPPHCNFANDAGRTVVDPTANSDNANAMAIDTGTGKIYVAGAYNGAGPCHNSASPASTPTGPWTPPSATTARHRPVR